MTQDTPKNQPNNPYLNARREWNERYGSEIKRAENWRLAALMIGVLCIIQEIGLVSMATQSKLVPYVVKVDKLGTAVAVGRAEAMDQKAELNVTKAQVARFIVDARSVVGDAFAQREQINRLYSMLPAGSRSHKLLSESFQKDDPFKKGETTSVTVRITNVIRVSEKTWQIEWEEATSATNSTNPVVQNWRANLSVAVNPPTTESQILANPLGIFVTDLNWSQII